MNNRLSQKPLMFVATSTCNNFYGRQIQISTIQDICVKKWFISSLCVYTSYISLIRVEDCEKADQLLYFNLFRRVAKTELIPNQPFATGKKSSFKNISVTERKCQIYSNVSII